MRPERLIGCSGIHTLVKGANLELTEGGDAERELKWALAYADRVDPLTPWRKDIEKVKAEVAGKPCPDCGKIHAESEGQYDETAIDAPPQKEPAPRDGVTSEDDDERNRHT